MYLFRILAKKNVVTQSANTSATSTDAHTPSTSKNIGRTSTTVTWNSNVLRKDISAETSPFESAVNIDEPKMFIPHTVNDSA